MDIRFAKPADVPGILNLLRQVGQVHHQGRPDLFRNGAQKYGASGILSLMNSPQTPIFVAVEERKVLGYCFCRMEIFDHDPVMNNRITLYIDDLCVEETRRGQHIGEQLYRQVEQYARQRKCQAITLNVWAFNEKALAFYEKMGLKPLKIGMEAILQDAD